MSYFMHLFLEGGKNIAIGFFLFLSIRLKKKLTATVKKSKPNWPFLASGFQSSSSSKCISPPLVIKWHYELKNIKNCVLIGCQNWI